MIIPAAYAAQRSPRFGESNPQRMEFEFWRHMVHTGQTAYAARREHGQDGLSGSPVWSFHRFGQTRTLLPDGTMLFEVLDGTPRVAQVQFGNSYEHAKLPEPRTVFFETFADWVKVVEAAD